MRDIKGATINSLGISVTVDKVLYAHHESIGWDVEFIDTAGQYRHWKQWYDGGEIIGIVPHVDVNQPQWVLVVDGTTRLSLCRGDAHEKHQEREKGNNHA